MKNALQQIGIAALLLIALIMNLDTLQNSPFELFRVVSWYTVILATLGFVHFAYEGLLELYYEIDYIRYIRTHQ